MDYCLVLREVGYLYWNLGMEDFEEKLKEVIIDK